MTSSKKAPYIFLFVLFIVLVFILGLNYGKKVEQTNEKVNFVLSIAPTKAVTPTTALPITYSEFQHKDCGIGFTYPSYLIKEKDTSTSAQFKSKNGEILAFNCEKPAKVASPSPTIVDTKVATQSVTLDNKTFVGFYKTKNQLTISIPNTRKNSTVNVTIHKNLIKLFEETFNLLP